MKMKAIKNRRIFFLLAFLFLCGCARKQEVVVIMKPSFEDCDEFRCVWVVDSVIKGDKELISKGDVVYFINSKREYKSADTSLRLRVSGVASSEQINEHYTCRGTSIFYDRGFDVFKK